MAVAPVNKFLTVAVPVAPGPQKLYEVPTGVSSILLFAQVSNVGIAATYPAVTFWHRRTSRSTGNFRDTRIIRDIQIPPNDAVVLIDGRLVLEKDAIKVDEIYVDAKQTGIVSVTGAVYDEPSGIVTVTTLTPHNFPVGQEITLSGLEFKCPSGTGITTNFFPDPQQSYVVDTIVNDVGISKTFSANIGGAIGYPHTYVGNSVHTFVSAATSSIIAGGNYTHKFVRATDGAVIQGGDYTHTFVSAKTGAVKVTGGGNVTPTGATYDASNGNLVITKASHGLTTANTVGIITDGITFSCTMDGGTTDHAYPRRSDPKYNAFNLGITTFTTDTFTVNVGVSTIVNYNVSNASYTPSTGQLTLNIGAHSLKSGVTTTVQSADYSPVTGIMTVTIADHQFSAGERVKFDAESLRFSCTYGNGIHTFTSATSNAVNVQSGAESGNQKTPNGATYVPSSGLLTLSFASAHGMSTNDTITLDNDSIIFTCDADNHQTTHPYPRSTDPIAGVTTAVTVTSTTAFTINVGQSVGSNSTKAYPRVNDYAYNRWLPISNVTTNTFEVQVLGPNGYPSTDISPHTWVNAVGDMKKGGESIKIATNSLVFTCDMDNHASEHAYPRTTDPYYDTSIPIVSTTSDTITVNVGISSIVYHTPTDATYNPANGDLVVTIGSHKLMVGKNVKIATDSLGFTCDKDNNTVTKYYPRKDKDPAYNTSVAVGATTLNTVTLQIGAQAGGLVAPLQMEFLASILENSTT